MNLGRYRLVEQLGTGPDGIAYRAVQDQTEQACEVYDLAGARGDPQHWQKLVRRLRLAAMLRHPRQRQLLDLNLEGEPPFIALEATGARLLSEVQAEELPWAPTQVHQLAQELTSVLRAGHRWGLVHGALNPSNIHWQPGQGAKLDFTGAACRTTPNSPSDDVCRAPEWQADKNLDPAWDMFALGVVLSWLLRGRPAPPGWSLSSEFPKADEQTPLWIAVARLLRIDPNERPSAQALLEALAVGPVTQQVAEQLESTQVNLGPVPQPLEASDAQKIHQILGRFRLRELIGEGGLGKVYRAHDIIDNSLAAIKVLHPHLAVRPAVLQRFLKEARLLSEIHSPYVANILEINEDQGVHFLALEFIDGRSVSGLLMDRKLCPRSRLAEAHALALITDVTRGVAAAHRRGIIHRDIKPQNIMVLHGSGLFRLLEAGSQSSPTSVTQTPAQIEVGTKLCDFGLARHVVESDSLHLTQEGMPLGTPLYMSPEQATGQINLGPATDVYALGATLYHLLAGQPPFTADTVVALAMLHTKEPPAPLAQFQPNVSDGICRIVDKCLAKRPEDRYPDADALLQDLERLARGEPASMVVHPRVPVGDHVLEYDWSWELGSSPEQLWPYVSNTERLNRAVGLPAVNYSAKVSATSAGAELAATVERYGAFRKVGVVNAWREHPFEWVEGKRLGVLREYSQGIFNWLASTTELTAQPGGGTTLRQRIQLEPRNFLGRMAASLEVGFKGRRRLEQVYRRIDAYLRNQGAHAPNTDPFEEPIQLTKAQQRRLGQHLGQLLEKKVSPDVVSRLGAYLEQAPEQEVARIRPLALARRLEVNGDAMMAACLHGARQGLLVLLWDIMCPMCRIPAGIVDTLRALKEHGRCEACQVDFDLDFARSVEMVFRVHPEVRSAEPKTYCIGGPAHSPHVVAQVRVAAGERFELDLALTEGAYRLRGPQLPHALDFQVEPGAFITRWSLRIPRDFARSADEVALTSAEGTRLRIGGQRLVLENEHGEELTLRVERTAQRDDALTAARAAASGLFRELFPGEILESGRLVTVAAVTLLVLDLCQATSLDSPGNLYESIGEARTFGLLHDYFLLFEEGVRREGGALIKTLGETVLAAFEDKAAAARVGLVLAQGLPQELGRRWPQLRRPLQVRAGIHHGPAMSATINGALDYVGTTVDQALRLPAFVPGDHLILTRSLAADLRVAELLRAFNLKPKVLPANLPGQAFGVLVGVAVSR